MTSRPRPRAGAALLAVAELRLLLFWHRLRGRGGMAEGLAHLAGLGAGGALGLATAVMVGLGSLRAARSGSALDASAAAGATFFGLWVAWTALALTVNERELLDLRRLLVYPVPPLRLYAVAVGSALFADPLALFMGLALLGSWAGAALGRPGLWLVPYALLLFLFGAATVSLLALLQELLERLARHRWFREIALLAALVGWAGLAIVGVRGARSPVLVLRSVKALRWLFYPAALASEGGRHLYLGAGAAAWPWLAALGVLAAATFALAYRVALGTARAGGEAPVPPAVRRTPPGGWTGRAGPLLEKELRYLSRHPLARISLVVLPVLAALLAWRGAPRLQAQPNEILRALPLFGIAAYAHLVPQVFWLNAFGWERGGARTLFLAPVAPERVLVAKNAAVALLSLALLAAGAGSWLALAGAAPRWAVPSALLLHVALAPALYTVGNVVSVLNPRAAGFGVQRGGALPQLSALAGMGAFSGVAAVFAVPIFAALWLDRTWIVPAGWAALAVMGGVAWRVALPLTARLLVRRRDRLLAAVCGDDA